MTAQIIRFPAVRRSIAVSRDRGWNYVHIAVWLFSPFVWAVGMMWWYLT
jgi:hypothetical protein